MPETFTNRYVRQCKRCGHLIQTGEQASYRETFGVVCSKCSKPKQLPKRMDAELLIRQASE